jgi:hypothetical protein
LGKETIKTIKTKNLKLTTLELIHLRDLFSIILPGGNSVSKLLAEIEQRSIVDDTLWGKVESLCQESNLPIGHSAPDYVIGLLQTPTLGIIPINLDDEIILKSENVEEEETK